MHGSIGVLYIHENMCVCVCVCVCSCQQTASRDAGEHNKIGPVGENVLI